MEKISDPVLLELLGELGDPAGGRAV